MINRCLIAIVGIVLGGAVVWTFADDKKPVVQVQQGRVQFRERNELRRLDAPVTTPHHDHRHLPRPRSGHHWRWHSGHARYVLVPVTVSPNVMVLPPNYSLPNRVEVYETALATNCQCPVCGSRLVIQAGQ